MSADILLAHAIAAAKVRRQSLRILCETAYCQRQRLIEPWRTASAPMGATVRSREGLDISTGPANPPPSFGVGQK
jgi:hypothetical protein